MGLGVASGLLVCVMCLEIRLVGRPPWYTEVRVWRNGVLRLARQTLAVRIPPGPFSETHTPHREEEWEWDSKAPPPIPVAPPPPPHFHSLSGAARWGVGLALAGSASESPLPALPPGPYKRGLKQCTCKQTRSETQSQCTRIAQVPFTLSEATCNFQNALQLLRPQQAKTQHRRRQQQHPDTHHTDTTSPHHHHDNTAHDNSSNSNDTTAIRQQQPQPTPQQTHTHTHDQPKNTTTTQNTASSISKQLAHSAP